MKVCFFTLGCKVNQQETAAMIDIFKHNGFEIVSQEEQCDVYIVNSCTVTLSGDKKSIQWIRRAKRQSPNSVVVLCGCMPQAFPAKAQNVLEADIIIGSKGKNQVYNLVMEYLKDKNRIVNILPHSTQDKFEELSAESDSLHTRAFLKLQDGCNRECAYCIIPTARGSVRSASIESIVSSAEKMVRAGHKEIVLTGVNISCYGQDIGKNVCDVIEAIAKIPELSRIRLGSLELDLFTDDMLVRISNVEKFCPHFHLSLQSGCDKTLKAMNRLYDTSFYTSIMARICTLFYRPTFTTDIIVGFPGETEVDFLESVRYVKHCGFLKVHAFTFSPREGTRAYTMPDQIKTTIKQDRNKILTFKSDMEREKLLNEFIGFLDTVLLEQKNKDGYFTGYTTRYIPILIKPCDSMSVGDIVDVRLTGIIGQRMTCDVL